MSVSRRIAVTVVLAFSVVGAPSAAWGHGLHYIGTLEVTGNGTVTATTGQGVTGTEKVTVDGVTSTPSRAAGCAGSPTSTWYGGHFDQGYNAIGYNSDGSPKTEPQGCVDVHTTTGSASAPFGGSVTLSGSGFRPGTTFGVTYLFPNDEGDLDGDTEGQLQTDTNDPFCHRTYFLQGAGILKSFTTTGSVTNPTPDASVGNFSGVNVPLGASSVGLGQLCITSERFQYKGPAPETGDYLPTSQGQSVPLTVL